jgi:hypothetical protein
MGKTIVLSGKTLRCVEALPLGMYLDIAEAEGSTEPVQQVAALNKIVRAMVVPDDHTKLRRILYDTEKVITIEDLSEAIGTAMVQYSARPLGPSARSAAGPKPTGGTSRVVSLSVATDKAGKRSPKGGRSIAS